jgi:hypothetical protein
MIRLDDREYEALENIRTFHYNTDSVPFGQVVRALVNTYVENSGVGVKTFEE